MTLSSRVPRLIGAPVLILSSLATEAAWTPVTLAEPRAQRTGDRARPLADQSGCSHYPLPSASGKEPTHATCARRDRAATDGRRSPGAWRAALRPVPPAPGLAARHRAAAGRAGTCLRRLNKSALLETRVSTFLH